MPWHRPRAAAIALALCAAGCHHDLSVMGMLGVPTMARVASNIVLVDTSIDGGPHAPLLADTGSPFTLLDPTVFGEPLRNENQPKLDLTFGALTIEDIPTIQIRADGTLLAGIVGGDVMRQFPMRFDYRDMTLTFGDTAPVADVAAGTTVAFELEGGGRADLAPGVPISFPATRIAVDVDIEGVSHPFVLDTGASESALRFGLFTQLTADGRGTLDGLPITTVSGVGSARATRIRSLTLGGQSVTNAVAITIGDELLDNIVEEVGHPVDGLLGGTFLREFLLDIDYPHKHLVLSRWNDRGHIVDEFKRVGLVLGDAGTVVTVYAGSAAAQAGITKGDQVIAIDGEALAGIDAIASESLLTGVVGVVHHFEFGSANLSAIANHSVDLPVEDLIPTP